MKHSFWILLALLLVSVALNVGLLTREPQTETIIERDTVWLDTTIIKPVPTESKETGETIYIKVPARTIGDGSILCENDSTQNARTKKNRPQVCESPSVRDSQVIALPVEQKRYDDSLYTAWVSGYRPKLDSITLRLPTITETITNTIVKPAPRLSVGVQVGAGVGVIRHQPDIYVGFGAQWRLWPK